MATAGSATHATIDVAGRSSTDVGRAVGAAVGADGTYTVASVGHDTYQLVRTYRPTWAVALGILGIAFFGLGILCFLVRKTEVCTLKVVDGPTGAVLTITGKLAPATLAALRYALDGPSVAAESESGRAPGHHGPPPTGAPVTGLAEPPRAGTPGSASDLVILSSPIPPATHPASAPVEQDVEHTVHRVATGRACGSTGYWMRLPEGRVVPLVGTTLLGRDPAPLPGDVAPTLISLVDPSMQVSKTHLALRVLGDSLQVQDLHSTNGTVVNEPSGWRVALSGGESAPVKPGDSLELGGVRIEVGAGG